MGFHRGRKGLDAKKATGSTPAPQPRPILAMALEPRFMFDAAGAATVEAVQTDADPTAADHSADTHTSVDRVDTGIAAPSPSGPTEVRAADPAQNNGRKDVVFIDTSIVDYQMLVDSAKAGVEVVLLDGSKSGIAQMAEWAQSHSGYDSVSIVSHGWDAQLYVGTDFLWSGSIDRYQADLQSLGGALKSGGDILLYGCQLAESAEGQALIDRLHVLTGADIAASTDATGSVSLGRNWTLEVSAGTIETASLLDTAALDGFTESLADYTVTSNAGGSGTGTFEKAYADVIANGDTTTAKTIAFDSTAFDPATKTATERTVTLSANLPSLTKDISIDGDVNGDGIADVIIDGNGKTGINVATANVDVTLKSLEFKNFASTNNGDASVMRHNTTGGSVTIENSSFHDNTNTQATSGSGGVFFLTTSTNGTLQINIDRSVFYSNTSLKQGGAIHIAGSGTTVDVSGSITNSVFYDNTVTSTTDLSGGGAIRVIANGGTLTFANLTVAYNSISNSSATGAGISKSTAAGTLNIYNSLVVNNTGGSGGDIGGSTGLSTANNLTGSFSDFLFSGSAGNRDLRLASSATTAIDAGVSANLVSGKDSNDALSNPRTVGSTPDIGAYENNGTRTLDLDGGSGGSNYSVTYVSGGVGIGSSVGIGSVTSDTNVRSAIITLSSPGATESLSLTGTNSNINSVKYDQSTGTLILYSKPGASLADMQAAIANVKYVNSDGSASGSRSISVMLSDAVNSLASTVTVTFASTPATPSITSATYNASTNQLVVTGADITDGDSIDVTKLTLTGEGSSSYTLTSDSTVTSAPGSNVFTITLGATDQAFVEGLLNKDGTSSQGTTTYNLAAAANWDSTQSATADLTGNGITVSSTQKPTISSVTYDSTSGVLTVTGTNMVHQAGSANDIDLTKLTITGQGSGTASLTGTVEITSATSFTVTLSGATKTNVDALLNKSGTSSTGGTTYKFTATDDWNGPVFGDISDSTGTGITVTANDPPVIGNLNTDSVVWAGEGQTVLLDSGANATASDTENGAGSWTGSVLTVRRSVSGTATPLSADIFSFNSNGAFSESGGSLLDTANSNAVFGTVTNTNGTLTVTFNGSATATLIQTVMRNILYRNDTPTGDTVIRYSLTDGNGGSADADVTVTSDTIYVTNTADDAGTGVADGIGLREAVAIALADTTGTQTIKFAGGLASNTITLGSDLAVTENLTFDTDAASGLVIDGSTITLSSGVTLTLSNGASDTLSISSKITGSGGVTKTGAGTATLSGGNDYSGATGIDAGTLTVGGGSNGGIGDGSAVTVSSGATLNLSGNETIGSLAGAGSVTLGTSTLTVSPSSGSTTFSGAISGTGSLTKEGAGTLVLTGTNTHSGTTTVSAGTLELNSSAGTALADGGAVTLSGGTLTLSSTTETIGTLSGASGTLALGGNALTVAQANNRTFAGAITGTSSGSLILNGAANNTILALTGTTNSTGFAGAITILKGGLEVSADSNLGAGTLTLNGGTLRLTATAATIDNAVAIGSSGGTISVPPSGGDLTLSGAISGSGTMIKAAGGNLTLSGDNGSFTGAFNINAGTVTVSHANALGTTAGGTTVASGAALALSGGITIAENLTLSGSGVSSGGALVSASGGNTVSGTVTLNDDATITATGALTLSGVVSGAFNLTKAGSDSLTLSGTNSYTGTTTVSAGTLSISGSGNISAAAVTLAGGTLESTGSSVTLANDITLGTGNGTVSVGSGKALTLSGVISGANTLTKTGSGSLTLSGNSGYSGNTTVSAGTLVAGHNNALGTTAGSTTVSSGATLAIADGISLAEGLTIAGAGVSNAGALQVTAGSATLSGTVAMGANTIVGVSGTGLTLSGTVSGGFDLTKSGSGSLTLSGTNSYTGTTTVGGGTLVVTGTLNGSGAGAVTVGNGATLAGTGTVNGGLTIQSGATLAPGVSGTNSGVGTLTVNGGLTIASGGTLSVDLASSSSYDQVAVTGAVDVGSATLSVAGAYVPTKSASGDSFAIVSNDASDAVTGTFNGLASGATITLNSGSITIGYAAGTGSNDIVLTGPVNQAPALGGTATGPVNDNATATPFSAVTVTDADDSTGTFTVTITYTAANGTLTSANGGLTGTAGNYTLTASSPSDLQTLLQALVFTPTANQATPGGTVQTTFSLTTSDGTSSGTANTGTVITATSINDAPTAITLSNSSISVFEGSNGVVGTLSATDADTGQTLSYTLVAGTGDTNNGLFTISGTSLQANNPGSLTAGQTYSVRVQVSDGTATYEQAFSITVTNDLVVTVTAIDSSAPAGTYSADVADGGGLDLQEAIALANAATGNITIRFAGTLAGTITLPGTLTVRSGVTLTMDSDTDSRSITIAGNGLTLGSSFEVGVGDGDTLTINSTLADNGTDISALSKTGGGTLVLGGTNNTASGGTSGTGINGITVAAGTLSVGADANLGTGTVALNGGSLSVTGATTIDNAIDLNADSTITNSAAVTLSGALSGTSALTKAGSGTLTLSNSGNSGNFSGTTTVGAGTLSVAADGNLGSGAVTLNGGTLGLTGTGSIDNAITLGSSGGTVDASGTATLSGTISGTGTLTKTGGSALTLSGTNSYTGATTVSTGVLIAGSNGALGSTDGGTTVASGATLRLLGGLTIAENFTISGIGVSAGIGAIKVNDDANGRATTLTGTIALAADAAIGAYNGTDSLTVSGVVSGAYALTKVGSGGLTLSGANSYTGATTVSTGTLIAAHADALGTTGSGTTVTSGAALGLQGGITLAEAVSAAGTGVSGSGAIYNVSGTNTLSGAVTLTAAAAVGVNAGGLTMSGTIGGSFGLTKTGAETLTLSGTNGYSTLTVSAGTVSIAADGNLGSGTVSLAAGSTLQVTGATTIDNAVALTGSAAVRTDAAVTIGGNITGNSYTLTKSGSGTLTLSGTNNSSGSGVSGITVTAGTLAVGASANLGQTTLTLDGGTLASTAAFSNGNGVTLGSGGGTIDVSAGAVTLSGTVSGTGGLSIASTDGGNALGLSGTNTYTGGTTLGGGILQFGNDAAVGTGTLTINGGKVRGSDTTARTIANNLVLGGTMTMSGSAALTFTGSVDLGGATRTVDNTITEALTLSGAVSNGALTVANTSTGALVLGGTNSMTGITVSSGTLSVAAADNLGSGTVTLNGGALSITGTTTIANAIALSDGSTISNSAAATLSGVLSGSGALTKTGSGTLTLSGTNTHTGAVTVSAGTLAASGGSAIGDTSAVTVASGATLSLVVGNEAIGSLAGAGSVVLSYRLTVGDNSSTTFSGVISSTNSSGLTKTGTGTLTLSGANSYTGATTVSAGTLALTGNSAIADTNAVTVASGATLSVSGTETVGSIAGAGAIVLVGTLEAGGNNTSTEFSGVISGSGGGSLTKQGSGTLTLSGANTHNGGTTISAGTIIAASTGGLGESGVELAAGTTLSFAVTGSFGNYIQQSGVATINVGSGYTATLSNVISGNHGFTKTGTGTLALATGGSPDPGTTTVSAGTLLLTGGGSYDGAITVNSGATLAGTALLYGTLTIDAGGTLAPGVAGTNNGIGSLTVNGNLSMSGTLAVEIAGTTAGTGYDQVIVSGGVTLASGSSAVTVIRVNGFAAVNAATYAVIDQTGVGTLSNTLSGLAQDATLSTNGDLYTVDYVGGTGNDFVLTSLVNPTVSSVGASTADGSYKAGDTVTITVTFTRAVTVTGTPTLGLGIAGRTASYSGGSGTTTLTFTYTVQDGDNSADLDYGATTSLSLNGGTIVDSSTSLDALLTLATPGAANSLGANKAIVIDTAAPTVSAVSAVNGTYKAGETIDITVTFSEAVSVTGTPTLAITLDDGTVVQAGYLSGSGGTALTFRYTVGTNLTDADGIGIGASISGGGIADLIGNGAVRTLNNIAGTGAVRIDSVAPTVTNVTSGTGNGTYTTGETISIQVTFSEAVTVTGTPTLALNTGRTASYSGGAGTNTLTFTYTVQAGDTAADLDAVSASALAGSITDIAGNAGVLTLTAPGDVRSLGLNKDIVIDTTAPSIRSIVPPADGTYGVGRTLSFYIQASEVVIVNGTPTITLDIGGQTRQAVYNPAASSGSVLRFDYVVQAGDADADGIAVTGMNLNGGSITDLARIPLPATLGGLPGLQNVLVDTVAPATPSVPVLAAGQDTGSSATDGLTGINRPTVGGTAEPGATVTVLVDGTAVGTTTAGADGSWSYSLTTPLAEGSHAIASRATDPAGNVSGTSATLTLTVDATPPVLSTPSVAGGLDNTANVTAATRPTFTGTAEPNSTVTVIIDGVAAGTVTTGADGSWSFTPATPLADGAHSIATTMTDTAGNVGRSGMLTLTVDTQAPTISTGAGPTLSAGGTATLGSAVSLSDAGTLNRVTVGLTDARSGDELVIGTLPAGITATRDGNSIVLTGVASAADYQAAVRAIGLRSSAADPSFDGTATSRSIAISARDIAGNSSIAASVTVTVSRATATTDTNNTTTLPVTSTPVTTSGNGPSQSGSSTTGSSSNGPSSNGSSTNGSSSGFGSSLPSLPGSSNGGGSGGPGTPGSASSTDAGRSVTLNSVGGSSASTDAGRSVTLNSVGGSSASTDAGRSVTLNSIGGGSSGSGGLGGSGLSGGGLGGGLGTGLGGSLGGSSLGGGLGGFGTGGTPGGINTGAGTGLGTGTGTGGTTGGQTGQGTPGQTGPQGTGLNGRQGQQGQGPQGNGAGPGQNRGPSAGQPGTPGGQPTTLTPRSQPQGQPQGPQGPAAPQDQQGQGQGQDQPQDTPQDGGGIPADGTGRPADRGADSRAEIMPASPGFARQVAQVHGGPAGAADLLAALASHVLPDSRAA